MTSENRWLLPDGIDELLPARAARVERLRRDLLDACAQWGFRYVIPPLVEFTDSLLVGLGADLNLLTCKFVDRASGRTLGVRADITPQVSRIDAHSLGESGVTRLCYAGSTLHSAAQSVTAGRSPIQLGAELYGCESTAADIEVISLMLALLTNVPCDRKLTLDIGHVGIVEAVLADCGLDDAAQTAVFDALQRKSAPDLAAVLVDLPSDVAARLQALSALHGGTEVLARARTLLAENPAAMAALDVLSGVVGQIQALHPALDLYIDLTELRSFRYHTGIVFAAYLEGVGTAVAKGGRYDNVGQVYGRARPATGFALDLKTLAEAAAPDTAGEAAVAAPDNTDPALAAAVAALRASGRVVITTLDGVPDARCAETLVLRDGEWIVVAGEGAENQ